MVRKTKATKKPAAAGGTKKTVTAKSTTPTKSRPKTTKATPSGPGRSTKQLKIGQKAPAFSLPNQDGKIMRLADFKGKKVVLYFYPKDDTPGCTKESCAFRDGLDEIHASGAVVLGISGDSVDSHKKFAKKFNLNFPLLSDETKTVCCRPTACGKKNRCTAGTSWESSARRSLSMNKANSTISSRRSKWTVTWRKSWPNSTSCRSLVSYCG